MKSNKKAQGINMQTILIVALIIAIIIWVYKAGLLN